MASNTKEHDIEQGIVKAQGNKVPPSSGEDQGIVKAQGKAPPPSQGTVPATVVSVCDDDTHNYNSLKYRFWMQAGLTSAVSIFCITMMAVNGKEGIYLPVLTGIVGYWLPSPDARVKRPRDK